MGYKKQIFLLLAISVISFLIALVVLCESIPSGNCYGRWGEAGQTLGVFSITIFLLSLILLFLREEVFRAWFKFARIYIPLTLVFIFLSALSPGGGSWGVGNNFDGEAATWFFSGLFLLISLILIVRKSWKLKKSSV